MVPSRKINLVDFVVYDSSIEEIRNRCSRKAYAILSQKWGPAEDIPVFKGTKRPELIDDAVWGKKLQFVDHYSTHLDFPRHFDANSPFDASKLPPALEHPVCFRVNIPFNEHPNFSISKADLLSWEKENGKIVANSLVLLDTDYAMRKWQIPDKYVLDYPGLSIEGAKFLVEERNVAAIGIDSLTLDDYSMTTQLKFPTSAYLASKQVLGIPNLGGQLSKFPSKDGVCVMAFLRAEGGTAAPVSLFGLLPPEAHSLTTPTTVGEAVDAVTGAAVRFSNAGIFAMLLAAFVLLY
jgi:kynurenine formamidase